MSVFEDIGSHAYVKHDYDTSVNPTRNLLHTIKGERPMITCFLRYRIDMYKVSAFEEYAQMWIPLVEKFGGMHHGYYLPHESDSDLAVALFSFPSLAEYEAYRTKSLDDPDCQLAYAHADQTKCITSYERHFLRPVQPK